MKLRSRGVQLKYAPSHAHRSVPRVTTLLVFTRAVSTSAAVIDSHGYPSPFGVTSAD